MTKKTKNIVRALKKRFETLYIILENEEDKKEIEDILLLIDEKLDD